MKTKSDILYGTHTFQVCNIELCPLHKKCAVFAGCVVFRKSAHFSYLEKWECIKLPINNMKSISGCVMPEIMEEY